jgi:hypothetical protein
VQVSQSGGAEPVWGSGGRRLYYRTGRAMMAASVSTTSTAGSFLVTARDSLFGDVASGGMGHADYAVTPDGHFLVFGAATTAHPETVVALEWLRELRAALAAARTNVGSVPEW